MLPSASPTSSNPHERRDQAWGEPCGRETRLEDAAAGRADRGELPERTTLHLVAGGWNAARFLLMVGRRQLQFRLPWASLFAIEGGPHPAEAPTQCKRLRKAVVWSQRSHGSRRQGDSDVRPWGFRIDATASLHSGSLAGTPTVAGAERQPLMHWSPTDAVPYCGMASR